MQSNEIIPTERTAGVPAAQDGPKGWEKRYESSNTFEMKEKREENTAKEEVKMR